MSRYRRAFDDSTGARHGGMPTFGWRMAPDGWVTRRQLRADGLCPGRRPPVGQLLWRGVGGTRVAYLYDRAHARPKRVPSPAQLAALDKALAARRTCRRCGTDAGYCLPRSVDVCPTCDPHDLESESPDMPALDRDTLLAAALDAAARGWHVFPLRPNDKRPAVTNWQTRATTDAERIRRCWSAGAYGVGIACGPSGLVVVDLDVPKEPDDRAPDEWRALGVLCGDDVLVMLAERYAEPLPYETYIVRTASGGTHLYFTAPAGAALRNTAGRIGWKIDTRAAGGYVVGAGSVVRGKPYRLVHDAPAAPLPGWLARLLDPPRPATRPAPVAIPRSTRRYVAAALHNEVQRVRDAADGTRNDTLFRAALALGRFIASGEPAARTGRERAPGRRRHGGAGRPQERRHHPQRHHGGTLTARNRIDLLTLAEVIQELKISRSTFYYWRQTKKAPRCVVLPNGEIRVRRDDLDTWLIGRVEAA